jgi:hypothetical protein
MRGKSDELDIHIMTFETELQHLSAPVLTVRSAHEPIVPHYKYRTLYTTKKGLTEALAKAA